MAWNLSVRGGGALAFAFSLVAAGAHAQEQPSPLASGLLGMPEAPQAAARYVTPDGAVRFVFDRSGGQALLRFDDAEEIYALSAVPGPRGDEFFKTDSGEVMLRVTALGGVILFQGSTAGGAPAAGAGHAPPIAPPAPPLGGLKLRLKTLERETGRQRGAPVEIVAPDTSGAQAGLIYDAAERAADGLAAAPGAPVRRVAIELGARHGAWLQRDVLRVVVTPRLGYAGRPSSAAVRKALADR